VFVQQPHPLARRAFDGRLSSVQIGKRSSAALANPPDLPDEAPLPDNPIDQAAQDHEAKIRRGFSLFIASVLGRFDIAGVIHALKRNDVDAVLSAAGLDRLQDQAGPLAQAVQDAYQDSGQALIDSLHSGLVAAAEGQPEHAALVVPAADLAADYPHPLPIPAAGGPALPPAGAGAIPTQAPVPPSSAPAGGGTGAPPSPPAGPPYGDEIPPGKLPAIAVRFNSLDPNAVAYLQANEMKLIREVTDETRAAIRALVETGYTAGVNPNEFAIQIRQVIGLTKWQSQRVANFRKALEAVHLPDNQNNPLTRQLRDRRHDPTLLKARKTGSPLSDAQIDDMVEKYQKRWLAYRSRTIARTESIRTANAAAQESWRQLGAKGIFAPGAMRRFWLVALDDRVCPECLAIPGMNPNGVGLEEPFHTPFGDIDNAPLHPNCRCYFVVRVGKGAVAASKKLQGELLV
jgi:hypothetical protein